MRHIESFNENKSDSMRTFVRFGKLGLIKQKGFGSDTFHAPPTTKGFYAMPLKFQEFFLVGSIESTQAKYLGYPKEPERDAPESEWEDYYKKKDKRFRAVRHEFVIDQHTEFWHHLEDVVPNNEVTERYGSWIKTNYKTWLKAVSKERLKLRAESLEPWDRSKITPGERRDVPGGINSTRKRTGFYGIDHFEVFFDTKVF